MINKKSKLLTIISGIALFAFVAFSNVVTAQQTTGKISGKITDSDGQPLPGANVLVQGTSFGAAADEEGDYFILNLAPGEYNVVVQVMGYKTTTVEGVSISSGHTTPVNVALETEAVAGEEVVVTAEREVIEMDKSASVVTVTSEDILEVPAVKNLQDFLRKQSGFDIGENNEMLLRGGGVEQIQMQVDGMMLTNNAQNRPMVSMLNLSSIQEMQIIKGGFNAEYGNARSGFFSVVSKTGATDRYSASVDLRFSPPQLKHGGPSLIDTTNYYLRPYFDPAVAFVGTMNGSWDESTRGQYPEWEGWNSWADRLNTDDDPSNDQTANEAQEMFRWHHLAEGADGLGHPHADKGRYWDYTDNFADVSLSGPIPIIGGLLGNASFFLSLSNQSDAFAMPVSRPTLDRRNAMLKLTSRPGDGMVLNISSLYSETFSVRGGVDGGGAGGSGQSGQYVEDPYGVLYSGKFSAGSRNVFYPYNTTPMDVYRNQRSISFDHVLNAKTSYSVKLTNVHVKYYGDKDLIPVRDFTIIQNFGSQGVDETPYGQSQEGYVYMNGDNQLRALGAGAKDKSWVNSYNFKFDVTSQVNKFNQVKAGIQYNTDDLSTDFGLFDEFDVTGNYHMVWDQQPNRLGAYVQNKLEFEGMIANFGIRMDVNNPNSMWYDATQRYSKYYKQQYRDTFQDSASSIMTDAEGDINFSPRLGISHPISATSKLFFNYGHFYNMPPTFDMYSIQPAGGAGGISFIGNPSAVMPRTIQYELGWEKELGNNFLFRAMGYYKNAQRQTGEVSYISYDNSVNYNTIQNNNYADTRGLEITLEKNFGTYVTGYLNYDYRVDNEGYFGRQVYYEDPREQLLYGLQNPYQEKPLARPIANGNIRIMSPDSWGPLLGGLSLSVLMTYRAGRYDTWDPLTSYEINNIQWKDEYFFDMRFEKRTQLAGVQITAFADIKNIFDAKYISQIGWGTGNDQRFYLSSLHLPRYDSEEYKNAGLPTPPASWSGTAPEYWATITYDDKVGDRADQDGKSHINMPDNDMLIYMNPRFVTFGIGFNF